VKQGRPQAKDVPEAPILAVLAASSGWVMIWDLKLQSLIDRKLIDGCTCGCRGDFELTPAGRASLA
jgi:hypothetical protein